MVRIRLARVGSKKRPFYRVSVADSRFARNGRNIEFIGYYNPRMEPPALSIDLARADFWISKGAQPSETVASLLKRLRAADAAPAAEQA